LSRFGLPSRVFLIFRLHAVGKCAIIFKLFALYKTMFFWLVHIYFMDKEMLDYV